MGVLLAGHPREPYVRVDPWKDWPGLHALTWTGWDGQAWDLTGADPIAEKGVALAARVRGLDYGPIDAWTMDSAGADGAAYLGYRAQSREVFIAVRVWHHGGSQAFIDFDSQFARSFLPAMRDWDGTWVRKPGKLTVTQQSGKSRSLEVYPRHGGDIEYDRDPSMFGRATYGRYLDAHRPFWTGDEVTPGGFSQGGASGFFGGKTGGFGPPFVIGAGGTFSAAAIDNPGDEPAWPVWTITGPCTKVAIGTPGRQANITITLGSGETLVVDTDPLAQTFTRGDGAVVRPPTIGLDGEPFAPIMPGQGRPLATEMTGTGRVSVKLTPLYHRAW